MNEKNHTLIELLLGIVLWGLLIQLGVYLIFEEDLYNAIGLWSGVAVAVFMAVHMYQTIKKQLEMDEESAAKYARNCASLRRFAVIIGLIVVASFHLGNVLAMLAGIFTLKFAAYTQPMLHRIFKRFY